VPVAITILGSDELEALDNLAPGVFDHGVNPALAREFLNDPRHHLAVARDGETIVGMASGVHYVHPDKPPELWINEVGVAATHRKQGVGQQLVTTLLNHARTLGCVEAWVLTDRSNAAAMKLYQSAGGGERPEETVMYMFKLR
jgi:aminoglycoside 6'-N-acetyltransferase I